VEHLGPQRRRLRAVGADEVVEQARGRLLKQAVPERLEALDGSLRSAPGRVRRRRSAVGARRRHRCRCGAPRPAPRAAAPRAGRGTSRPNRTAPRRSSGSHARSTLRQSSGRRRRVGCANPIPPANRWFSGRGPSLGTPQPKRRFDLKRGSAPCDPADIRQRSDGRGRYRPLGKAPQEARPRDAAPAAR
jgi:hypothetical protein